MEWAPTPQVLAEKIMNAEFDALQTIINDPSLEAEPAVDSLIAVGQEIYDNFSLINPAQTICLKTSFPEHYHAFLQKKLQLLEDHMKQNISKGLDSGEYKPNIDTTVTLAKYIKRIEDLHTSKALIAGHLTFGTVFNNIIEEFIYEVATEENWHYFRSRKQLIEVFHFGK